MKNLHTRDGYNIEDGKGSSYTFTDWSCLPVSHKEQEELKDKKTIIFIY